MPHPDAPGTGANDLSDSIDTKQKDEAQLQQRSSPAAVLKSNEFPVAQEPTPPEEAPAPVPSSSLPRAKRNKISRGSLTTLIRNYPLRPNQRIRSSIL